MGHTQILGSGLFPPSQLLVHRGSLVVVSSARVGSEGQCPADCGAAALPPIRVPPQGGHLEVWGHLCHAQGGPQGVFTGHLAISRAEGSVLASLGPGDRAEPAPLCKFQSLCPPPEFWVLGACTIAGGLPDQQRVSVDRFGLVDWKEARIVLRLPRSSCPGGRRKGHGQSPGRGPRSE